MRKKTYCVEPNPDDMDARWKETRRDFSNYEVIWDSMFSNPKLYATYQEARRGLL